MSICCRLDDEQLTRRLIELVREERMHLAELLEHLAEFDERDIVSRTSYPSLFAYCTRELGYSESAAFKRIHAAKAAKAFPVILDHLRSGSIHLTAVVMLKAHLTRENHLQVIAQAKGLNKFDLERLIASLAPRADAPDRICRVANRELSVSTSSPAEEPSVPVSPSPSARPEQSIHPTAPERIRFSFTGSDELLGLLKRAQDILRHKYPAGDLEQIFSEALEALLDKKDPERKLSAKECKAAAGSAREARPMSVWAFAARSVPQSVKDIVWRRDAGRCVFVSGGGKRCEERGNLEFDHIVPFSLGGPSNNPKNIRLLCRAHNLAEARLKLGEAALRRQGGLSAPETSARPSC